jgi:hypothetical protein
MVTLLTRPTIERRHLSLFPIQEQSLTPPATSWLGQPVISVQDQLLAMEQRLPTFHREPFIVNGIENPAYDVIVEDDTDYPITTVSKSYGLVQHSTVFGKALEGLNRLGFDVHGLHSELSLTAHGERMKISLTLPGYDFDPGDGCPLVLKMNLLNSVDKTTAVAVELEWLRLVCGNGMMYGIGAAGFRKAHFRGIDEDDIAEYLSISLRSVPQDHQLMQGWLTTDVTLSRTMTWVDRPLAELWGEPTAARIWHILRSGNDARPEIIRGKDDEVEISRPAHERPVIPLGSIPGAFAPVQNAYHAAQALSWVAKEHPNLGTRLKRLKEIPTLMQQLL